MSKIADNLIRNCEKGSVKSLWNEIKKRDITGDPTLYLYIEKVVERKNLTRDEAQNAMDILMHGRASDKQIGALLTGLHVKVETPEEIASFALMMREHAKKISPEIPGGATLGDTCGTGGDSLNTFNISTTIMFILSAAGIPIAKHGNRAITSKCGSADVLEKLGVRIDLQPDSVKECIEKIGIGFMYAPIFHPAMKHVQKIRKEIGHHTIFNYLGPLSNPASAQCQILGVNRPELTNTFAEVLKLLGIDRAMTVCGFVENSDEYMDELSTIGKTKITELKGGKIESSEVFPESFGIKRVNKQAIIGGDPAKNAAILKDVLAGKASSARIDIAIFNAGAGMYIFNKSSTIQEGMKLAEEKIADGSALKKLNELIKLSEKLGKTLDRTKNEM